MKKIILVVLLFIIGLIIFSYPFVSDLLMKQRMISKINIYKLNISNLDNEIVCKEWEKARIYNEKLRENTFQLPHMQTSGKLLPDNYLDVLSIEEVMAVLEIPKINVNLPIYHGVSDDILKKGVGHIEGTTLPIGGEGMHSFLTSHTGLPETKLLTDLVKIQLGDVFFVRVLGGKIAYQVDQIDIIEPHEIVNYAKWSDGDYITLVTCIPYGVNSHRLLVRGKHINIIHIPPVFEDRNAYFPWQLIVIVVSIIIFVAMLLILLLVKREKKSKN